MIIYTAATWIYIRAERAEGGLNGGQTAKIG